MFLRKNYSKKTGRTHLSIVQGYRDADGKNKHKTVKSVGYLDVLEKEYPDVIAHFSAIAKSMDDERKISNKIPLTIDMTTQLTLENVNCKNYGYLVFSKLYHELEIDRFLNNARRHKNFKFNSEAIMRLLVYSRLLTPGSKREAVINKDKFFDNFDFTLDDVYHALDHFHEISAPLQKHLHEKVVEQYDRKTDLVYYDVTNYYFEIDKQDELRKKGFSKEGRKSPIVQMGLLMDSSGMPISYKLFPGNTHDSQTLMPVLKELKKRFGVKRLITVADKGLHSGDNIAFATALCDGYIYSKSIRGASEEFKKWVLDEKGYQETEKTKIKSKLVPNAALWVSVEQKGKKAKKKMLHVEQKWIVFYSEKYAKRAKHKRNEVIAKALKMIGNPHKYRNSYDNGAVGYIKNIKVSKDTGEIINVNESLHLDIAKIEEEEKFDGYYALVTSELDDDEQEIIDTYKGLWRIEETFKISKTVLGTRPIYLQTEEHINAHFLICFIALLIARAVEIKLDRKFSISRITETLHKVTCSRMEQNIWLFNYRDEVTDNLNSVFGTDFGSKFMTLEKIKNNFSLSKK
ncbi:MAG: IS1634 family transposase [Nitrososphaerota archaeon]|jgi:transposase|nr:IS1634 family transposase [Nitrososphaerota archaeon]